MAATAIQHPHPIDKNASILWSRDLLNRENDWLVVVVEPGKQAGKIHSAAVMTPNGKIVLSMTNPDVGDLFRRLADLFVNKEIVVWDLASHHTLLEQTALHNDLPLLNFKGHCAMRHFARYCGQVNETGSDYTLQELPARKAIRNTTDKIKAILDNLFYMAGTNQVNESANTGDTHWSASFYRPKQGPATFIRNIFGLNNNNNKP